MDSRQQGENRFSRFLTRVAVLLAILVLVPLTVFVLPRFFSGGSGPGMSMVTEPGVARLSGDPVLLAQDLDGDGSVDCLKKIPALTFFKKGYTATPDARRCRGRGMKPMPEDLRAMLTDLVRIRTELVAQRGEILDLDGDGQADCITFGTTRFQAPDRSCPDPAQDVEPLTGPARELASEALALETEVRASIDL